MAMCFFLVSEESRRALCKSLNDFVRFVFSLRLGGHITSHQHRLIRCSFAVYNKFRAAIFFPYIASDQVP
jgi:hypothetical protein